MKTKDLLDILYSNNTTCICCGEDIFDDAHGICEHCLKTLPYLKGRVCLHCSEPLISDGDYCKACKGKHFMFNRAIAPFCYQDRIVSLVHGLKYQNKKFVASPLAYFMAETYKNHNFNCDIIIPVPLCEKRFKQRGYNQTELIGRELSKCINVSLECKSLIRVKETPSQTKLTRQQRKDNMIDAFKVVNKKNIKNKVILLIDDVYTTGATINECSKVLNKAGAKKIYALTLAHTVNKQRKPTLLTKLKQFILKVFKKDNKSN